MHSGDNLTGAGEGDDEQINVNISKLSNNVKSMFFTVNIYTLDKTFEGVHNAYVRVIDHQNREICRFSLADCGLSNAVLLTRVYFFEFFNNIYLLFILLFNL